MAIYLHGADADPIDVTRQFAPRGISGLGFLMCLYFKFVMYAALLLVAPPAPVLRMHLPPAAGCSCLFSGFVLTSSTHVK